MPSVSANFGSWWLALAATSGSRRPRCCSWRAIVGWRPPGIDSSLVRLRYAYADALARTRTRPEAQTWFTRVAAEDTEQLTDAAEVLTTLGPTG